MTTKLLDIPNGRGEYEKIRATYLNHGCFATCYRVGDTVYALVRKGMNYTDLSKEGVALFCQGTHIPKIKALGEAKRKKYYVYTMPFYNDLKDKSSQAWLQWEKLCKIKDGMPACPTKGGYSYNKEIIKRLKLSHAAPDVISDLEKINNALSQYGDDYFFEFGQNNVKVDNGENLILLDVIFSRNAYWDDDD